MSRFVKYQHIERFGTSEVRDIEYGECYVFPKIDGTNASVWCEGGKVQAGSRKRHLTDDVPDNAGFREWVKGNRRLKEFMWNSAWDRLYGEWLVPHTIKAYRYSAWRKFYIFDVIDDEGKYVPFDIYSKELDAHGLDYIFPLFRITNPGIEKLHAALEANDYLMEDGKGAGEGIVIKNYSFVNRYGRTTWAKMVRAEFKEKHAKNEGPPNKLAKSAVEESIIDNFLTESMIDKVYAKIEQDGGFTPKQIPRLLNTVYYDLVKEECWNFVKKNKNPRIDFKRLMGFCFQRIKQIKPEIFR